MALTFLSASVLLWGGKVYGEEALAAELSGGEPEMEPLFELGVGGGLGYLPDYPGSDQGKVRSIALPYGIYRGQLFRADQDGGVRTRLLKGVGFEMDLSFSGSFPSNSDSNKARQGMEDLDWMFEVGPQLKVFLRPFNPKYRVEFRAPIRAIFSTNFKRTRDQGYNFTPNFIVQRRNTPYDGANFLWRLTFNYGSERINQYFYEVTPPDVTPERPLYNATPGYMGWALSMGQSFPFYDNIFYIAYRYANYNWAANRESPLFRAPENHTFGMGIIWQLFESKKLVPSSSQTP